MSIHSPRHSQTHQDAADGGFWHERALVEALRRWRRDPLGARLAMALFGPEALRAQSGGADLMEDAAAKPDLRAWMEWGPGTRREALVSAKLARAGSTDGPERPMHHAARVRFEDAALHGLLPPNDAFEARGALLAHFIDGEPLSAQDPALAAAAMAHLASSWETVARSAIEGLGDPKATHLVISVAHVAPDGSLSLSSTHAMEAAGAIALLSSLAPSMSSPREGQIGTLGSRLMHIQRGQALSMGAQRDIQIKINVGALRAACAELPDFERPAKPSGPT
jgi:hypothetical protein